VTSTRRLLTVLTTLLVSGCALLPAAATADGVPLGEAPTLPEGTTTLGAAAPQRELSLTVALEPSDPAALEAFATAVSTPGSPVYGQYLSPAEFGARFGADEEEMGAVRGTLAARGLTVGAPGPNRLSLPVTTTVEGAEAAFGLSVVRVELPDGRVAIANDRAPVLPAVAAPYVQTVTGLSNVATPVPAGGTSRTRHASTLLPGASALTRAASAAPTGKTTRSARPSVVTGGPSPCEAATEYAAEEGFLTTDEVGGAYGFPALYGAGNFGAGQTVALMEFEPYAPSDIAEFQKCFGTAVPIVNEAIKGGAGPYAGSDGESALDIEQVIALAPGVHIAVFEAPNEGGTELEVLEAWVRQGTAKVMSSSWGLCEPSTEEGFAQAKNTLLEEATTQGQSFFVAAGDEGSTDCYGEETKEEESWKELAVDSPSDTPFATSVGGTRLDLGSAPNGEYVWNDNPKEGGGGGGVSEIFAMPGYQSGAAPSVGVTAASAGAECIVAGGLCRQVPDVSANADPGTAYTVFTEGSWGGTGGTSAAAPLWAAMTALVNADPACEGHAVGFANPALYAIAGVDYAANFRDITAAKPGGRPNNNVFDANGLYPLRTGYDMATGLGSPNAPALAASICAFLNPQPTPPVKTEPVKTEPVTSPPAATPPSMPKSKSKSKTKPGRVRHATLNGLSGAKPRIAFRLSAATGGSLKSVTVKLPTGVSVGPKKTLAHGVVVTNGSRVPVKVSGSGQTLRIALAKLAASATFKLAAPAIVGPSRRTKHAKTHRKPRVSLVVLETGGTSRYRFAAKS
jgi:subtilase family serine protease